MTSIDTNLLLFAYDADCPLHEDAFEFITSLHGRNDVVISEFTLTELYRLLRNPVVLKNPLSAPEAVAVVQRYREHPEWRLAGFPPGNSSALHDELWRIAAQPAFAYRRIYDARLALTLRQHGVTDFATVNLKDFEGFGFRRVWNPLE